MNLVWCLVVVAAVLYALSWWIEARTRPACGPQGCFCRDSCSWLVGVSPEDWKRGVRAPVGEAHAEPLPCAECHGFPALSGSRYCLHCDNLPPADRFFSSAEDVQ